MKTRIAAFFPVIVAALMAAGASRAASVTVGDPDAATGGNAFPFGGTYSVVYHGTEYQQVYDASFFGSSPISIESITFYASRDAGQNANGVYTLSLSTTSAAVNGLDANMAANLGADNAVVWSGALPAYSSLLTFKLALPFVYDPTQGNLLLDVTFQDVTINSFAYYASHYGDLVGSSRMVDGGGLDTDGFGLVTTFQFGPAATVPEPAALAMLATALPGMLALGWARRRRAA